MTYAAHKCDLWRMQPSIWETALRPVHTGTNIGALFASVFQRVFCVHTRAIFADDEPSEHANLFPDIRWRLM